ncbi:VOC family protein [Opitutaceae bacterium TAV4]|nr:VOC family protein [Opitutaceae bacterium TAV4]
MFTFPFRISIVLSALVLSASAWAAETPAKVPSEKAGMAYRPERRFIWHEIQTTDVAAAARFYTSVFNWTKIDAPTVGGDRPYVMLQRDDNVFVGLAPLSDYGSKGSPRWLAWIGVADVDASLDAIVKAGGLLEKAPFDHLIGRTAFVGDPAQARFAIVRPHFRQPFIFQLPLTWHAVHAPEKDALQTLPAFYKTVFNWSASEVMFSLRTTLPVLTTGGVRIAGLVTPPWGSHSSIAPPLDSAVWQTYVEVSDLRASLARFAAGGGKQLAADDDIPGFGKVVRVADPQGAELILFQRAAQNL